MSQIVVDRGGYLVDATQRARELFTIGAADIGRPFRDMPLSYRPMDLTGAIARAYEERGTVSAGRINWSQLNGPDRALEVHITPVPGPEGEPLGAAVAFTDVTALTRLRQDYEHSRNELQTAYEELQSTVEELETTNEELQSTNEELETTNEELQSTNEELETMNEELQSTNDELETMNQEVTDRAGELDRVNLVLEGILGTLGVGVAVVDQDRRVQVWNAMATDLWGLRAEEVEGQDFLTLEIGLPVAELDDAVGRVLRGAREEQQSLSAVSRRGRQLECMVRVLSLVTRAGDTYGAMILMTPTPSAGEAVAAEAAP
jgi:two-component system CheB/CheR fusion protein